MIYNLALTNLFQVLLLSTSLLYRFKELSLGCLNTAICILLLLLPVYSSLNFVWDYPGELVPER